MEIESIHFYVENADRMQDWLISKLGLQRLKYHYNLDDRCIDGANNITSIGNVGNNNLHLIISSPDRGASQVTNYLDHHPPGVKNIAFRVDNLAEIRQRVERRGVKILMDCLTEDHLPVLTIPGWGSIEHTIYQAPILPRVNRWKSISNDDSPGAITGIDHLVLNVPAGELTTAVTWYRDIFDFRVDQTFTINTDRSGLFSQALISPCGKIRFNINEPSSPNSQIQEFLDLNGGVGIQHIALYTDNIFETVDQMQQQGVEFLPIPNTYYTNLKMRTGGRISSLLTSGELQALEHLQILADWSENTPEALLLQTFTKPIFNQPTFFFEIIERRDRAQGFGEGNFQALFAAIEEYNETKQNQLSIAIDMP